MLAIKHICNQLNPIAKKYFSRYYHLNCYNRRCSILLSSQDTSDTKAPVHTTQQESTQQPEQQAQQPAPAPVVNGAEVTAVFNEDCWTEVKVDGNVVLSETVKKVAI